MSKPLEERRYVHEILDIVYFRQKTHTVYNRSSKTYGPIAGKTNKLQENRQG